MKKRPKIPATVSGPSGLVKVRFDTNLKGDKGEDAYGLWDASLRTITLDKTLTPEFQLRIYFHELAHVALDDSGLQNCLSAEMVEAICDAFATARMRELSGR